MAIRQKTSVCPTMVCQLFTDLLLMEIFVGTVEIQPIVSALPIPGVKP